MPTYQLLTDRSLAQSSAITPTTLIHIVYTGDPSQNIAGSSYKAELQQLSSIFSTSTFSGGSGNCIADLYVTNIHGCSPITIYDSIRSTGTTVSGLTSFSFGFETSATTDYSFAVGAQTIASGSASHAEGFQTTASGNFSHSEGYLTYTTNNGSHAEGFQTSAVTSYSHSEGTNTYALGSGSHAEGAGSISSGSTSHAEGWNTIAGGQNSHAEGSGTTSVGISSHAEGFGAISIGNYSHAEGSFTRSTNTGSHAEGSGTTASGTHSHAEGIATSATTQGAHAEGVLTLASDDGAHAEGYLTIASDVAAHSEGSGTTASAFYSHSEGVGTIASGNGSHSEGFGTIASGTYSHAEGRETKSIATYSHAAGRETIANGSYQSVIGQWNLTAVTESAFIIGNGTSDLNRSNLLFAANSGVTVYGDFTANTISATTYLNLPLGNYGSGLTFNVGTYDLSLDGGNGVLDTINLGVLSSDLTITGGTYNNGTGVASFTNNTGGTFNVTGFLVGYTDTLVTGATYSNNTFTFRNSTGGTFDVLFNTVTGLTSTGNISVGGDIVITGSVIPNVSLTDTTSAITPTYGTDLIHITGLTSGLTINAPTGSWPDGKDLTIRIKDNGVARTISWNVIYRSIGVTLPNITVPTKTTYVGIIYNKTDNKFDVIGSTTEL